MIRATLDAPAIRACLATAVDHAGGPAAWGRVHGWSASHVRGVLDGSRRVPVGMLAAVGLERRSVVVERKDYDQDVAA